MAAKQTVTQDRKCALCERPCEPHQRNVDGTYLHDACAAAAAGTVNRDRG